MALSTAAIKGVERMKERMEQEAAKAVAREETAAMSAELREGEKSQVDVEIEARLTDHKTTVGTEGKQPQAAIGVIEATEPAFESPLLLYFCNAKKHS